MRFATAGDQAAFDQVVRRHGPMVSRICARLCRTGPDAEDAAQAVFLILARKAAELHGRTSLAGWLHRTAAHTALRQRRGALTRRRHERLAGALRPDANRGRAGLAPCCADEDEDLHRLHRAISALPEDYRNALILHHLEGHTVEQVARLLATRPGTIAARLSRGRAMLRDRLGVMGIILVAATLDELLIRAGGGIASAEELVAGGAPVDASGAGIAAPGASSAARSLASGGALSATAAAPLTAVAHLKVATVLIGLSMTTLAAAGGATYHFFAPVDPPPGDNRALDASLLRTDDPPPPHRDSTWGARVSVPEPSGLVVLAPLALLLSRRRTRPSLSDRTTAE